MKRLILVIAVILLVGMVLLSACSSAPPPPTSAATKAAPATSQAQPPGGGHPYSTPVMTVPAVTSAAPTASAPRTTTAYPAATSPASAGPWGAPTTPAATSPNIGLAVGGAKDIINFRENIRNGYLPLPTDVTYEGLFYDYYFDTGASGPTDKLFSPSYSFAATRDPLSHQPEYYLSVGLNSGLKESDFQRKNLNLMIVLDDSGSMDSDFDQYYYDGYGNRIDAYAEDGINRLRKMESAKESVVAILDQLNEGDRFGIVLFNSGASLYVPMKPATSGNIQNAKNLMWNVRAGGSTNLAAGIDMATNEFRNLRELSSYEYENRMVVLTDAQPNTGDFSSAGIMGRVQNNAGSRIYSTFIGIGVDFNSQLAEDITKTKGANYYSVHSPRQFRQRVNEEFEYMVTPLVFNLQLRFESNGWRIEKVFGSPEANQATGDLMRINTMFPSKSEGGQTKGGLVLLKLRKTSNAANAPVYLKTSYEDRNGRTDSSAVTIMPETTAPEYFDNSGIRKGVLLSRYAALLKNWMTDERQHLQYSRPWDPCVREDTGIIIPVENSQWERQSVPLTISQPYRQVFRNFSTYFTQEMNAIGDNSMSQELGILSTLYR